MFMPTTSHTISHTTSYAMFIRLDLERGSGGSNCMHDRAGTGVCMAMDSFRHRPPNQRRQGQAAPERHRRRTAARPGPSAGLPALRGRRAAGAAQAAAKGKGKGARGNTAHLKVSNMLERSLSTMKQNLSLKNSISRYKL